MADIPVDGPLVDRFGRAVTKLRVSVTDRCDLRCVYCMPAAGLPWKARAELLTFEEITRLVGVFAGMGVRKVRLTGGEPLVRAELPELARQLRQAVPAVSLSLTSNGVLLGGLAEALGSAGVGSVNISLDSLDRQRFQELTRRDALERVLAGIEAACAVWPGRVKLNAVSLVDHTLDEALAFCELAQRLDLVVRFIEFMPLDADEAWSSDRVLPGEVLRERIESRYALEPSNADDPNAPAREYRFVGSPGGVGFIDPVSEPFCSRCDRVRLTADGKLRACLFATDEDDLRAPLRAGADDVALAQAIRRAIWAKQPGHGIGEEGFVAASRSMSQIGG